MRSAVVPTSRSAEQPPQAPRTAAHASGVVAAVIGGAGGIAGGAIGGGDEASVAKAMVGSRTHEAGPLPERWARTPTAASTAMPAAAPTAPARRIEKARPNGLARTIAPCRPARKGPSRGAGPGSDVPDGALHVDRRHLLRSRGERPRERPVADEIDHPRDAPRRAVQLHERGAREGEGADEPRDAEPVLDIARGVARGQRLEAAADADPLVELVQLPAPELVQQLGVAHEQHLEQLLPRHVDRGQDADLLERLDAHLLGLVDDHHHALALGPEGQEVAGERGHQLAVGRSGARDAEVVEDRADQLRAGEIRVDDEDTANVRGQLGAERAAQERSCRCPRLRRGP